MGRRDGRRGQPFDAGRHLGGVQAGGVDQDSRVQFQGRFAADADPPEAAVAPGSPKGAAQGQGGAGAFGFAQQGQHEAVAVHDAGGRGEQGGAAAQGRFQGPGLGGVETVQVRYAVGLALALQGVEAGFLGRRGGDDELAAGPVGHLVGAAEFVEQFPPPQAQGRLMGAARVVEAGVDDFAVAGAGLLAESGVLFHHHRVDAAPRQFPGAGQAHHPGADHHRSRPFRHRPLPVTGSADSSRGLDCCGALR